ncbi:MAG: hypothetical protein ABFD63_06520 [Smithella sp.]
MENSKCSAEILFSPLTKEYIVPEIKYCPLTKEYCNTHCKWYLRDGKCVMNEISYTLELTVEMLTKILSKEI